MKASKGASEDIDEARSEGIRLTVHNTNGIRCVWMLTGVATHQSISRRRETE